MFFCSFPQDDSLSKPIYHMSFLWYCATGMVITIVVSLLSSLYFGRQDSSEVDPKLIIPLLRKYMKPQKYESVKDGEQEMCEKPNKLVQFQQEKKEIVK